jgi:hypothetical protein
MPSTIHLNEIEERQGTPYGFRQFEPNKPNSSDSSIAENIQSAIAGLNESDATIEAKVSDLNDEFTNFEATA